MFSRSAAGAGPAARGALALALMFALGACRGSAPATPRSLPAGATAAVSPTIVASVVGDSTAFGARITGLGYGPDRASYVLNKPAYVAFIGVTDRAIASLIPAIGVESKIESAGAHTAGLNNSARGDRVADRFGARRGIADVDASAAQLQEYNRCLARAREADRQRAEGQRRVIGRDSAGRPIYGPPEYRADVQSAESYCRAPQAPQTSRQAGINSIGRVPAQRGRMLILYVSDTPVAHKDVLELAITETDPKLVALSIGRKLFGQRGAQWSAHLVPW